MATVRVPALHLQAEFMLAQLAVSAGRILDADGEEVGFVFQIPKTGNISAFHFRTGTVTTGDDLKVSGQGVTAGGLPDGTIAQSGTITIAGGDDDVPKRVALGTDWAVTRGAWKSVVFEFNAYVAGNLEIEVGNTNQAFNNHCYVTHDTGGGHVEQTLPPILYLEYDDGICYRIANGFDCWRSQTYAGDSADDPDEWGNVFQVEAELGCTGVAYLADIDGDPEIVLYDSSHSALETLSLLDASRRVGSLKLGVVFFDSVHTISANTDYRIVFKPTSGTTVVSTRYLDFATSAALTAFYNSSTMRTHRADGATPWTDTNTELFAIWPIFTEVPDASGGSSGDLRAPSLGGVLEE